MKSVFTVIFCFLVSHIYSQSCTIQINPGGTQCGGTKVELSISNPNPQTTYSWDFNNDRQEDAQGAKVTYTLPKRAGTSNFNVTATVSINNNQCGSQVINVRDVPSAELGVPNSVQDAILENRVIRVCNTTVSSFDLQLINRSTTTATNQSYTIDWGGGNVANLGANDFNGSIKNTFTGIGYRNILFTVNGSNGCNNTEQFRYFRGSNPKFDLGNPGSTINLCAPATLNIPLTNTANNPPGTEYIVSVNGQPKLNYLQEVVPSSFPLVFDETSCGKNTSTNKSKNAYDVEVKAINPCGLSLSTIEPIEVSGTPIPDFSIQSLQNCPGQLFTLQNTTANIFEVKNGGSNNPSTCEKNLLADWEISPGQQNVDWRNEGTSLFGVQKLNVTFLKAGDYTVTMFIKSAACGIKMIKNTISIQPAPTADANASFKTKNQCTGEEVTFNNFSTGNGLSYTWTVTGPAGGHTFINNTNANAKNPSLRFDKAGSYNVKLESKNVCSKATWDTTIVLNSAPQVSFEKIPDQCERAELNFSPSQVKIESTLPITSEWTFNGANPAGSTDKNPQKIIYNLPGTYIITLKANNTCGDGTFRDTFLVQSPVALSLPKDTTLCRNTGTLTLKAFPTGGKWSGNKAVQENGLLKPADLPTGETILTYNFGTGVCRAEGKIKITLIDPPTVDAGNDRVLCANGNQLQLMATPSGGTWSSPTGKISTEGVFNPVDNPVGTYRARYIFRDAKGCTNRDSVMVKVVAPTKVTAQNATYCNAPGLVNLPPATPSGGVWRGDKVVNSNQFDPIAAGGPGTYSLFYVLIDGNGCKDSAIAKISVVDAIVIQAGRDTQICTGKGMLNLNLGASPNLGRWSEAKLGDIPQGQVDLARLSVGTYTFSYQIGTGNCLVKDEKKIEILALPTIKLDNNPTQVCISTDTLALKAEPGSGTWSSTRGKLLGNNFLPKQSGTGTYDLVYNFINTQGCSQQSSIKIAVNPLPNIQVNDTSYCNVTVGVNLPKALPIGGTWSGNGVTGNQFFPQKAGGTGSYPVIYEVKDRNDCKNTDTITITVNDPNKIEAGSDLEVCISLNQLNLNDGTSPLNGRWREDKIGPVANGVFNPSAVTAGTYTFTYEIGAGSCLVSDQKKVTVLGLPQINLKDNPSAICISRDTLSLKASPNGGTWQSTTGIIEQGTFRALKSGAKNHNLSYSYTDGKGCSNRVAFDILVNPLPIVSSIDTSYCNTSGEVKLPEATPVGGAWSGLGVKNNRFSPQQAGGVGNYKLVYTYADNKQCSNSDTVNINVADPQKVEAGQDEQVCISEKTLDLNKTVTPAGGRWNEEKLGNIATGVFMPSIQKAGIYTFTYTVGAGNCAVSDQKKIEVLSLPSLDLKNNPTGVCVNVDSVVLNSTPLGGTWSSRKGIIKKQSFFPKSSGAGNYFLRYQFSDAKGCSGIDSIPFVVNGLPKIQTQDTTYCNTPGTVTLPITQPAGGNWKGKGVKNNQFDPQTAGGLGEYPVVYTYKDAQGCIDSARIKIAVTAPPVVDAGANDTFCIDESPVTLRNFSPQTGGTWEGPGIVNKSTGQIDLYLAKGGLHRYQYSVGVGNCKVSDAIELSIIDLTKVNAGLLQTVCFAEKELQLSGANPVGGIWIGSGVIDSIKGTFAPTLVGEGTFSLQYKLTDKASGCTASAKKEVTVYPMPESSFKLPVEACTSSPVQFENTSRSKVKAYWEFGDSRYSDEISPSHIFQDTGVFQIKLSASNEFGCKDDTTVSIYIFEPPTAVFDMDKNKGCAVLPVTFDNKSKGYRTRYEWDFGDGQRSFLAKPDTVFFKQGRGDTTYIITLSAINACATRQFKDSLRVFPLPVAEFGIPVDTNCTPIKAVFSNTTFGKPENYFWDLGNGKTWTGAMPPTQIYATDTLPSTYQITLIATNFCGQDTFTRNLLVNPIDVESFFNIPNPRGCQPFSVQFSNFSTPDAFVEWSFGDGNTSAMPNPVYVYQKPGIYEVVQKASNGCGFDSTVAKIEVLPAPIVKFEHPAKICPNTEFNFSNRSQQLAGDFWSFGNGDSSLIKSPTYLYKNSGTYTITLTGISTLNGCPNQYQSSIEVLPKPSTSFDIDTTSGCQPFTLEFRQRSSPSSLYFNWNFGDDNSGVGSKSSHQYTKAGLYEASLVSKDQYGCFSDTAKVLINVFPIPPADYTFSMDKPCGLPTTISFKHQHQANLGYNWNFGNGRQSIENLPVQTYTDTGRYQITLRTVNEFGCQSQQITPIRLYQKPKAAFVLERFNACTGSLLPLANISLFSDRYRWTFGDGRSSTARDPEYRYAQPGNYRIKLWVSNGSGCADSTETPQLLKVLPSPFADFDFSEISHDNRPSGIVQFKELAQNELTYEWDFGDGDASSDSNPIHRFRSNGEKTVRLEVKGANLCNDDTTKVIPLGFFGGLFVPNVMAPDQALQDARLFLPKGVGLKTYHLQIFSTFGDLIWESKDLTLEGSPLQGWDGTKNGRPMPQDTYVWKISATYQNNKLWLGESTRKGKNKTSGTFLLMR